MSDAVFLALLKRAGLPMPEREVRFHPSRRFRSDWGWPAHRLVLEIEGGLYGVGKPCKVCGRRRPAGHTSIDRLKRDLEKYNELTAVGWRLLRVTPQQLCHPDTMNLIRRALDP